MKKITYVIQDAVGIHARPAGELAKIAKSGQSEVNISANGKQVALKKLMAVMALGIKQGQEIELSIEGEDEEAIAAALQDFLEKNL
jgi:phosphocarrier protein HPr